MRKVGRPLTQEKIQTSKRSAKEVQAYLLNLHEVGGVVNHAIYSKSKCERYH